MRKGKWGMYIITAQNRRNKMNESQKGKKCPFFFRRAVVVHAFNSSTQEAEASESLRVQNQPGLQELVPG